MTLALRRARLALPLALSLAAAALVTAPATVLAQDDAAEPSEPAALEHWRRGLELFQTGRHDEAAHELEAAYQAQPSRTILFAWAQAERLTGDCATASTLYRRYLATQPEERARRAAETMLAACEQAMAQPARASPEARPAPRPPRPETPPPPERSPWFADPLGLALTGGAVLAAAGGVALFVVSGSTASEVATSYDQGDENLHDARVERGISIGLLIGAGVLAIVAALRFITAASGD